MRKVNGCVTHRSKAIPVRASYAVETAILLNKVLL